MQAGRQGGVGVVFSASVVLCLKVEWSLGWGKCCVFSYSIGLKGLSLVSRIELESSVISELAG